MQKMSKFRGQIRFQIRVLLKKLKVYILINDNIEEY